MALVNMKELLRQAEAGGFAVGSFSVANMECVRGVLQAAEENHAPIIMQIAAPLTAIWVFKRKNSGTPINAPLPKQMSCRFVRLKRTFVFTAFKSFGTGT